MTNPTHSNRSIAGFSLMEALVAAFVLMVAIMGVFPMIILTSKGNTADRNRINAANEARRQIEYVRTLSYDSLGPGIAGSDPAFLGYYESDVDEPGYTLGEDYYLTETVTLTPGTTGTLNIIVEPVDDALDGLGAADTDLRPLDYKRVSAILNWTEQGHPKRVRQVTVIEGESLISEGGKEDGKGGMGKGKKSKKKKGDSGTE